MGLITENENDHPDSGVDHHAGQGGNFHRYLRVFRWGADSKEHGDGLRFSGQGQCLQGAAQHDADGSYDVFFGPEKPEGEVNWGQTIPNKGWNVLWRIYSPTQVWYDKAWRQGEIVRVK